jgi:ABC transporter substrate binding protein (PQQ-dependent alcohol dehydrogenase system)
VNRIPSRAASALAATFVLASIVIAAADPIEIKVGYLRLPKLRSTISLVEAPPENNGLAGARAGIDDDNTTGKFLGQRFSLEDVKLKEGDDPGQAMAAMADRGISLVIADLPANLLLKAADGGRARGQLLFNAGAIDERLREDDCRANVVHTAPTRAMLADALAQYLAWKRWRRWFFLVGTHEADKLNADALRRAAGRFGAKIVEERVIEAAGGSRRSDSGVVQMQRQIPVFTQQALAYDVLVAADESDVFAGYLPYRTWDPRPVAGSAGLIPTSWDASHDQWDATQMQSRFVKQFGRRMTALDMQAWMAARMIGESATQVRATDAKAMLAFLRSPAFALAAFKGQKLTLRDWNQQLRQPILLTNGRTVVSVSPQEGFLHEFSELDTLGVDRGESKCRLQ